MKIDFEMLEKLAAAGATAHVIIEFLRAQDAKREPKRKRDRTDKQTKAGRKRAKPSENERNDATVDDSPRARLFREGTSALVGLNRTERASRGLIAQWLKLTHDDDQLVLATILRARDLAVADAAGWVLATLKGKTTNGHGPRSMAAAADDLIARAEEREREDGPGAPRRPV